MKQPELYDVIMVYGEPRVVMQITDGRISNSIPIRQYMEQITIVQYNGVYMTVAEVLDARIQEALEARNK